ncbi:hypothetical protein CR513_05568, partial [Mucuna pruriens]
MQQLAKILAKRYEIDEDMLKLFKKVEINIPLLDAIKQIPKYTKFLKELYVHRRKKIKGIVIKTSVPIFNEFCQESIFIVPYTIDNHPFTDAMLGLRASVNVIPASIYRSLNLGDLEPTGMVIQLANRSVVQSLGILKDVLVQVNKLIFLADFYVLDMEDEPFGEGSALILGRPFLMTTRTKIDVHAGILSMEFGNTFVKFNIFQALKHLAEHNSIFSIDTIEGLVKEYAQISIDHANLVNFVDISYVINKFYTKAAKADFEMLYHILPFSDQPLHLHVHNSIGGGCPTDVVKKEFTKLLVVEIIYPILDSQWVSLVQVVPKKSRMIVIKNRQDEMVPTRIQISWRVCIDYRKLSQATRKDHFSLPFVDQMLEKLAGYMQIHIVSMDQHKTTFTCPFGMFAYTRMPFGLYNTPSTFQRCMISIFSNLLEDCMEVFMDDFIVYAESFEACLNNLSKVLRRCVDSNLVLNFEK